MTQYLTSGIRLPMHACHFNHSVVVILERKMLLGPSNLESMNQEKSYVCCIICNLNIRVLCPRILH